MVCFPPTGRFPKRPASPSRRCMPRFRIQLHARLESRNVPRPIGSGAAWERENWGLSADDALDHHPRLDPPKLTGTETPDRIWIRLERQLLVRLSGSAILFGIRVSCHRLDHLCDKGPEMRARIGRALRTMPEEAAHYKGLSAAAPGSCAGSRSSLEQPGASGRHGSVNGSGGNTRALRIHSPSCFFSCRR